MKSPNFGVDPFGVDPRSTVLGFGDQVVPVVGLEPT